MNHIQWIRTAFWHGAPRAGDESAWQTLIERDLIEAFRKIPGVHDAKACWPDKREDGPPEIACQFLVEFSSRENMDRMLSSSERAAIRPLVQQALALFDGHVSHIEYRVS